MKTEKIFIALFILALFAHFFNVPGQILLLAFSLLTLSILYFPFGFYFYSVNTIKQQNIALSIFGGMILSIIPLGLLFKLAVWPGYQIQLSLALILTPVLLVITLILSQKNNGELKLYYKNYLTRIFFWLALCFVFNFISTETLIKIEYRNDPELKELKLKAFENPDDHQYYEAIDNYYRQQDSIALTVKTEK